MDPDKILITGASGQYARLAVQGLLSKGVLPASLLLVSRSPSRLSAHVARGVTARQGSFNDSLDELAATFTGARTMLLIATSKAGQRLTEHQRAIDAAKKAGVTHIIYTSFVGADLLNHEALVVSEHKATGS